MPSKLSAHFKPDSNPYDNTAKIKYIQKNFRNKTKDILDHIISIVEEYEEMGYYLTVRQVYYQLGYHVI